MTPSEKLLLRELETGPATIHDLAPVLGLKRNQLLRLTKKLHSAGLIRITTWERARGAPRRVWALGCGRDAPRPEPLSRTQVVYRYREKHPEWHRAYQRAWWAKNAAQLNARRRARNGAPPNVPVNLTTRAADEPRK